MSKLYRGKLAGVFRGPNGYYCGMMSSDGVGHYHPINGGNGWSAKALREATEAAQAEDAGVDVEEEADAKGQNENHRRV